MAIIVATVTILIKKAIVTRLIELVIVTRLIELIIVTRLIELVITIMNYQYLHPQIYHLINHYWIFKELLTI